MEIIDVKYGEGGSIVHAHIEETVKKMVSMTRGGGGNAGHYQLKPKGKLAGKTKKGGHQTTALYRRENEGGHLYPRGGGGAIGRKSRQSGGGERAGSMRGDWGVGPPLKKDHTRKMAWWG